MSDFFEYAAALSRTQARTTLRLTYQPEFADDNWEPRDKYVTAEQVAADEAGCYLHGDPLTGR